MHERLEPARQCLGPLLHQHDLPVAHADGQDVAVVADIEEELPGAFLRLAAQVGQHVEAVEMNLEGLVADLVALQQLGRDVRLSSGGEESRQPVLMADDTVQHRARLNLARPAHERGDPPAAFPIGVLFAAERRDAGVRPGIVVRAIVGRVKDDRIVGDAELVELARASGRYARHARPSRRCIRPGRCSCLMLVGAVRAEVHGRWYCTRGRTACRPCASCR